MNNNNPTDFHRLARYHDRRAGDLIHHASALRDGVRGFGRYAHLRLVVLRKRRVARLFDTISKLAAKSFAHQTLRNNYLDMIIENDT